MAFSADWNSSGIGYNGAGLFIRADTAEVRIDWGPGPRQTAALDLDTDGDGIADAVDVFHLFPSDGNYDIAVFQNPNPGVPPVRLKAFMHTSDTAGLTIGGSFLDDMILTGSGRDTITGANGDDWVDAGAGADRVEGQIGDDFLLGAAGDDFLYGGIGSDLLSGGDDKDSLYGQAGRDFLYGDGGEDLIIAGDGDDYLDGGAGVDKLVGGAGFDTFAFGPLRMPDGTYVFQDDPARDIVQDFQQGSDSINLYAWGPMDFIGTATFSGNGPEARYFTVPGSTFIQGDYDGDGALDFSIRLVGAFTLTQGDVTTAPFSVDI